MQAMPLAKSTVRPAALDSPKRHLPKISHDVEVGNINVPRAQWREVADPTEAGAVADLTAAAVRQRKPAFPLAYAGEFG